MKKYINKKSWNSNLFWQVIVTSIKITNITINNYNITVHNDNPKERRWGLEFKMRVF